MRTILISGSLVFALFLGAKAQVTNNPNAISGTVRFSNVNPAILSILDAPGNEGLDYLYMTASSLPPAQPRVSTATIDPPTSRLSSAYAITVDSDPVGIQYSVTPRASLIDNRETYYFLPRTSAPVFPVGAVPALNFSECLGVVTVRFRTSGGAAAAINSESCRAARGRHYGGSGQHICDRSRVHARTRASARTFREFGPAVAVPGHSTFRL